MPPKKVGRRQYTDAEKIAYYKEMARKANMNGGSVTTRGGKVRTAQYYSGKKKAVKSDTSSGGTVRSVGRSLGGLAASSVGLPPKVGTFLGGKIGHLVEHITGFGDYTIENNSIMEGGLTPPQIVNSVDRGGYIVRHREYICDLTASTSFNCQTFPVNPGIPSIFPWLSQVASSYEEYEFRGLMFEFKSLSSDALLSSATSTALGFVAMATQYNPTNPPFSDKKLLENYEYSNSRKPSECFIHPVECKRRLNVDTHLYIRTGSVPSGEDPKFYDLGVLNVAVGGCQASGGVLGELWVTYEVELFHPKYSLNGESLCDHWNNQTVTSANPLGLNRLLGTGSNLGTILSSTTITFPDYITDGNFLIIGVWTGSSIAGVSPPTMVPTLNCSFNNFWVGGTTSTVPIPSNPYTGSNVGFTACVNISGPGAVVTVIGSAATLPTSPQLDLWIVSAGRIES